MTTEAPKYPLPRPETDDAPFFEAAKRHELVAQQCAGCKKFQHPPGETCPNCRCETFQWTKLSGKGVIYSFVVVHQPTNPAFLEKVPYNVVQVEPEDAPGIRFIGNVVNVDNADLKVGMRACRPSLTMRTQRSRCCAGSHARPHLCSGVRKWSGYGQSEAWKWLLWRGH